MRLVVGFTDVDLPTLSASLADRKINPRVHYFCSPMPIKWLLWRRCHTAAENLDNICLAGLNLGGSCHDVSVILWIEAANVL